MFFMLILFIPGVLSSIIQQTFETSCGTVLGDKHGIYSSTKTESKIQCAIDCGSEETCTSFDFCQTSREYICRMRSVRSYTCSNDVTECLFFQGETNKESQTSENEVSQFTTLSDSEQQGTLSLLSGDPVTTNISPVTSINGNIMTETTNEEEPNSNTKTQEESTASSDVNERHDTQSENSYQDITTNVVTSKFLEKEAIDSTSRQAETVGSTSLSSETVDSTSRQAETVGSTSLPTETVDSTSQPTETVDSTSLPTETIDSTSQPTETADSTSRPTETVGAVGLPTENVGSMSLPSETADETKTIQTPEKDSTQYDNYERYTDEMSGTVKEPEF